MTRVLLVGYYGYGNFGDDVLERLFTDWLVSNEKVSYLKILHRENRAISENVEFVKRFSPLGLLSAIKSSDVVIFGGGGLLQDTSSSKSLYFYLGIILIAKLFCKKVLLAFQGVGPVNKIFNRFLLKHITSKCVDYVSVRDRDSVLLLRHLRTNKRIYQYKDPSFKYLQPRSDKKSGKVLGVNVREVKGVFGIKELPLVADAINKLPRDINVEIYMLDADREKVLLERLQSLIVRDSVIKNIHIDNYQELFTCDYLLSMRLHLLILAYINKVPMLGIAYDTKISNIAKNLHVPCVSYDFDNLSSYLKNLIENDDKYKSGKEVAFKIEKIDEGFCELDNWL